MDAIFHMLIFMPSFFSCRVHVRRLKNSMSQAYILFFLIYSSPVLQIFAIQNQDKEESIKAELLGELEINNSEVLW